jgi:hypothetical protein
MPDTRQALVKLLGALGSSSQFVASGCLTPVLPGLEIGGIGKIGCPISAASAKKLIAKASQAPYGKGVETIVDTKVRRVWQIEPSHIALRNAQWNTFIEEIVDEVKAELGIEQNVTAELYKLLVYEKGSFFAPHRDTEKAPGMFATLVVCLPSPHEGGTLIVSHDGQSKRIDFGGEDSEFEAQYAAFYADCQHEIEPVTSGYRVCLVYNLLNAGKQRSPAAPKNASAVEQATRLLKKLFADPAESLLKIAIPFGHQYTLAGIDPKRLKGADRSRADVLVRAAEALDYQCFTALLTHHQTGEADPDTWNYHPYRSRRSRYWSGGKAEDRDESAVGMGEVYEEELTLEHWLDAKGRKQPFGEMQLEEKEILSKADKGKWSFNQEVHEATGNEGVSVERWYRQGVIVIWPRRNYYAILAAEGQFSSMPALEALAQGAKKPAVLEDCRTFAEAIIARWRPMPLRHSIATAKPFSTRMLKLLAAFGTEELALRYLRDVLPKDYNANDGKPLHKLCLRLGWERLGPVIRDFIALQKPDDRNAHLASLVSLCVPHCCDPSAMTEERRAACGPIMDELLNAVERWDAVKTPSWQRRDEKRTGIIENLLRIFAANASTERLGEFLIRALTDIERYGLREMLIPDVKAIHTWLGKLPAAQPVAAQLLQHCLAELRNATARPVEPPGDWSRPAEFECQGQDCSELRRFLSDPLERTWRFRASKDRRERIVHMIRFHHCDVSHVLDRSGSPKTLVCTKTQASYELRRKHYEADRVLIAELEALSPGGETTALARPMRLRKTKK